MEAASRSVGGFDDDDDDERDGSSQKGDTGGMADGKSGDQRPSTPRSKHSATEQRRRSKINDRFQILRELIPPHSSDQKRDKASFLLEVIEYIRFLQEKVQKYESVYPEWNEENAKLDPWVKVYFRSIWKNARNSIQGPADGIADHSQVMRNGSASSGFIYSGKFDDNSASIQPTVLPAAQNLTDSGMNTGVPYKAVETLPSFASDMLNEQEELTIDEGMISVSSTYSQGVLSTLTQALQSSGIDLSQANVSVQINLAKRSASKRPVVNSMSSAKDHDDPLLTGDRVIGHSMVGSNGEESEQASKRQRPDDS